MDKAGKTVLVTGATGTQGFSVARTLKREGWGVRALVRDAAKPKAQLLAQQGVELTLGNLDDRASLDFALRDIYGVFSVQGFMEGGLEGEIRQGKALADAARTANVQHLVYSSVHSADLNTGVPHFDSKGQVEDHIRAIGVPNTVLRPVFFMENFTNYFPPSLEDGVHVLRLAIHPDTKLSMIAADDIGAFTAIALREPERYIGKAFEIGGELLTGPEIAERMQQHLGTPVRFDELPIAAVRGFSEDFALMFEFFVSTGQPIDRSSLHTIHPALMDFADWLKATQWRPPGTS